MKLLAALLLSLVALPAVASVHPIPGVYSTGVDDSNALLPGGSFDTHYSLVVTPFSQSEFPTPADPYVYGASEVQDVHDVYPGSWALNTSTSQWIGPTAESMFPFDPDWAGTFEYVLTFDLTGLIPSTAQILGAWATDNGSEMYLNGNLVATKGSTGYSALTNFNLTSGFVSGINELRFVVFNEFANLADNPTGLQVNITSATAETPEPVSLLVWSGLAMVVGLATARRERS